MHKVKIKGSSNKLRTRIAQFGEVWDCPKLAPGTHSSNEPRTMGCFQGQMGVTIVSEDGVHIRNVRMSDIENSGEIHDQ